MSASRRLLEIIMALSSLWSLKPRPFSQPPPSRVSNQPPPPMISTTQTTPQPQPISPPPTETPTQTVKMFDIPPEEKFPECKDPAYWYKVVEKCYSGWCGIAICYPYAISLMDGIYQPKNLPEPTTEQRWCIERNSRIKCELPISDDLLYTIFHEIYGYNIDYLKSERPKFFYKYVAYPEDLCKDWYGIGYIEKHRFVDCQTLRYYEILSGKT